MTSLTLVKKKKQTGVGTALAVQWLGLHALTKSSSSIHSQGTKIPTSHAVWPKIKAGAILFISMYFTLYAH